MSFHVCGVLHDNSKSNQSRNMKFEYIVVYENSSEVFDVIHCQIKHSRSRLLKVFKHFPYISQYKLSGTITEL